MAQKTIFRSLIKALIFIAILLPMMLLTRVEVLKSPNLKSFLSSIVALDENDTSYLFVGSSRVQASLDPSILKRELNISSLHNCGLVKSTFLESCIVTEHLIQQKGHKKIFMELSLFKPLMTQEVMRFSDPSGISPYKVAQRIFNLSPRDLVLMTIDNINAKLFSLISFKRNFRRKHLRNRESTSFDWFGYSSQNRIDLYKQPIFLTVNDLEPGQSNLDATVYLDAIKYLYDLADKNNAEIYYFLPMTYLLEDEKSEVVATFQKLEDHQKITFPENFLTRLANPKLLFDANHYNTSGAEVYSKEFSKLIKGMELE